MEANNPNDIPRHPIGVVTRRTGLSTHVLRAWERRHGLVQPRRGESGRRLYTDGEVERLTLVHAAVRAGRPVAQVAALALEELRRLAREDQARSAADDGRPRELREQAWEAVAALDPDRLGILLRRALLLLGLQPFLETVLTPLLVETGERWHAGRLGIAQEHAASACVAHLLESLVRELDVPGEAPRVVLATPAGERHGLGALMAAVVAAGQGWQVRWLGTDLPADQVAAAASLGSCRVVALSVAAEQPGMREEVLALRAALPDALPLLVGGAGGAGLAADGVTRVRDLQHWRALLEGLRTGPKFQARRRDGAAPAAGGRARGRKGEDV